MAKSYRVYCKLDGMTAVFSMYAVDVVTALMLVKAHFREINGACLAVVN